MKKFFFLLVLQLFAQAFASSSFAKDPPEFLFHWTTRGSLQWMMEQNKDPAHMPMQTIVETSSIAKAFPDLKNQIGTFAWIHPTSGMTGGTYEIYAKMDKAGHPPILISMKPAADATVLELKSTTGLEPIHDPSILNYDLIYHTHFDADGNEIYKEWLVLNPKKIEAFTADPGVVKKEIETEIKRMRAFRNPQLPDELVHYPKTFKQRLRVPVRTDKTLEAYLKNGKDGIPESIANRPFPEVPVQKAPYVYPPLSECWLRMVRQIF